MRPVAQSMWEWLAGSLPPSRLSLGGNQRDDAAQADKVARDLYADAEMAEAERVGAAYSLGRRAWHGDSVALHCLLSALAAVDNPNARRAAVSGLGAAGDAAVPGLLEALAAADRPAAVAQAAEALGEACRTPTLGVVEGLATAMERLRSSHYPSTTRPEKPKASEDNGANRAVVMQAQAFCTSPAECSYMCMSLSGRSFYSLIFIYKETYASGLPIQVRMRLSTLPSDSTRRSPHMKKEKAETQRLPSPRPRR